jgi:hypothetical protein
LAIASARAAANPHFPLTTLAAELETARTSLEPFASRDSRTDPRAVFSWSYDHLEANAQRMFRLLGLHPGPDITAPAASSLAGQPLPTVRAALLDLCGANLLTEHVPGRYTFHDLLRAYAGELAHADAEAGRHAAITRLLDHFLHTAKAAATLLNPALRRLDIPAHGVQVTAERLADVDEAAAWLSAELPVLLQAARLARQAGFDHHSWRFPCVLNEYLNRQGRWDVQISLLQAGLEAAQRLKDPAHSPL